MALKEDSSHAIFSIIQASVAATGTFRKGYSKHFEPWYYARFTSEFRPNSTDPLVQSMRQRKPMNGFVLEFFAQGILRRLGIRTATQKICSTREARSLPANYVVKAAGNSGGLKWIQNVQDTPKVSWDPEAVRSGWCLASRLEPDSASLDFVSRRLVRDQSPRTQMLQRSAATHAQADQALSELMAYTLGKTCVAADKFFSDFKPTESELKLIAKAMALDGEKYLRICAARVFIGCSAAHFGNVLTTKQGELISVDHCSGYYESGDDIRELMYFTDRSSDVFKILEGVNALTERDICDSVAEIPRHPACGWTAELADYFCTRLRLWKEHYANSERSAAMEIDPRLVYCNPLAELRARVITEACTPLWRA